MNLLDKASIILTASAYNNGEALCVKPSDGSGDFDFSRNSAATRVNAQGLVEDVQILSSNLVQNGDFSDGSTGWDILNGTVTDKYNASMTAYQSGIRINPFIYTGTFKVTFDLVVTSGSCKFVAGGANEQIFSTSGTKEIIVTNPSRFEFNAFNLGWVGTLDNVSAIQITDDTNLPRISYENFSYDGSGNIVPDSGCGSWLFEPQSTNLITYSEDFSTWATAGTITLESGYLSPDGTNNATKVTSSDLSGFLYNTAGMAANTTRSIYARAVSGSGTISLLSKNDNTNNNFTLTEQWQRLDLNNTLLTNSIFYAVDFRSGATLNEIILWGANATNDQDYVTSYISSNGTSVTRNQDVCNNNSIPALSGSHTVYADYNNYSFASGGNDRDWQSASGRIYLIYNYGGGLDVYNGSAFIVDRSTLIPATNFKIAIVTTPTTVKVFINGIDRTKAGALPNTTPITKWSTPPSGNVSQSLNSLVFFNEALSDEELTLLTTI